MKTPEGQGNGRNSNHKKNGLRQFLDFFQHEPDEQRQLPDHLHPHRKRFLAPYKARLRYVRDYWLYYLTTVLLLQVTLPVLLATLLFSTFMSFAFLEETRFSNNPDIR